MSNLHVYDQKITIVDSTGEAKTVPRTVSIHRGVNKQEFDVLASKVEQLTSDVKSEIHRVEQLFQLRYDQLENRIMERELPIDHGGEENMICTMDGICIASNHEPESAVFAPQEEQNKVSSPQQGEETHQIPPYLSELKVKVEELEHKLDTHVANPSHVQTSFQDTQAWNILNEKVNEIGSKLEGLGMGSRNNNLSEEQLRALVLQQVSTEVSTQLAKVWEEYKSTINPTAPNTIPTSEEAKVPSIESIDWEEKWKEFLSAAMEQIDTKITTSLAHHLEDYNKKLNEYREHCGTLIEYSRELGTAIQTLQVQMSELAARPAQIKEEDILRLIQKVHVDKNSPTQIDMTTTTRSVQTVNPVVKHVRAKK